jgi:hypothetical protein
MVKLFTQKFTLKTNSIWFTRSSYQWLVVFVDWFLVYTAKPDGLAQKLFFAIGAF